MQPQLRLLVTTIAMIVLSFVQAIGQTADTASLTSDREDYPPESFAVLTGKGFAPFEMVTVQVIDWSENGIRIDGDNDINPLHLPWQVQADELGNFVTSWYVDQYEVGLTLKATADGISSGKHAETFFTDATISGPTANISTDLSQNGAAPALTTIGDIVITEAANSDFAVGNGVTLIFSAPSGWNFKANTGSVSAQNSRNISNETITVNSTTITVTFDVGALDKSDKLTISGIQVQATEGGNLPSSGTIFRTGGTASVVGITNNVTSFGTLSQTLGALRLYTV
jgi:hypothetical protein